MEIEAKRSTTTNDRNDDYRNDDRHRQPVNSFFGLGQERNAT
jgi:hypothetical protein